MLRCLRLIVIGTMVIGLSACQYATNVEQVPVDSGMLGTQPPAASLTAQAYETASVRVTQTVDTANVEATQLASEMAPITPARGTSISTPDATTVLDYQAMPEIEYFQCEPCQITGGGSARLSWDLSGATAAYLDEQPVAAPDSVLVRPDQTTLYRLVATNENGRSEKTVTIVVEGIPVIHYFTCFPCKVSKGETATLSWDLSGGTAAYLDGEGITSPGSVLVAPDQTTTYRLEAVSDRGSVERLVTVEVDEGGTPEAVTAFLAQLGYEVLAVDEMALAGGGNTTAVVMSVVPGAWSDVEALSNQYEWGLRALDDNYPGKPLGVGLYDGVRFTRYVLVSAARYQAYLRGQIDRYQLWKSATWSVWDDWSRSWQIPRDRGFGQQDFTSKNFVY